MFIVIACVKAEALCKWDGCITVLIQRELAAPSGWRGAGAAAKGAKAPGDGVTAGRGLLRLVVAAEFLKREMQLTHTSSHLPSGPR